MCRSLIVVLLMILIVLNYGFYRTPDFIEDESGNWNEDVYEQLQFLKEQLRLGGANDMQQLFPEGHLFMNALYGLASADFAAGTDADTFGNSFIIYEDLPEGKAIREIGWAYNEINSPTGRKVFEEDLPLKYGVFYRGWQNYLLAQRLKKGNASPIGTADFQLNADAIALAFDRASSPWLESYSESAWPADNVIAMASLAAYDRHFHAYRYQKTITDWLEKVREQLDPKTGLIPHATDPRTGVIREGARGSSQSLMLCFLAEIDSVFAAEQYALYKEHFLDYRLGRAGIREYPKGQEGYGDVDSGPVIWGIGGSASVVGQRAAGINGDGLLFADLRGSLEAFGFPITWAGKKFYLFGQLPVADAFIAWSNSLEQEEGQFPSGPIPWTIHVLSLAICLLLGWLGWKI